MKIVGLKISHLIIYILSFIISLYYLPFLSIDSYIGIINAIIFWTSFYIFFSKVLENIIPGGLDDIEGYTRGVYYVSVFHQFIICSTFLYLILLYLPFPMETYFELPNINSSVTSVELDLLYRHVQYAIIGYEFKDFFICSLDLPFIVHHVFTFSGCCMSIFTKDGRFITALVAIIAELGSGFYSFYICVNRNIYAAVLYLIFMNASNFICGYLIYFYWIYGNVLFYRVGFVLLAVSLIALRTGGVVLGIQVMMAKDNKKMKRKLSVY